MRTIDVKAVHEFLKKNPQASYPDFLKTSGIKISNCSYYTIRRKFHGCNTQTRTSSSLYYSVFKIDSTGIGDKTKDVLKQFVETLNAKNGSRMELIEYSNPPRIEVRQNQKI